VEFLIFPLRFEEIENTIFCGISKVAFLNFSLNIIFNSVQNSRGAVKFFIAFHHFSQKRISFLGFW
jgi:hypothetical protein